MQDKEQLYKVVRYNRKTGHRKTLAKNLTEPEALKQAGEFPPSHKYFVTCSEQ